jgi:YfiH family protein
MRCEKGRGVIERHAHRCEYMQFDHLAGVPALTHAIFTRRGGYSSAPYAGLNLSFTTGDDATAVQRNREAVIQTLGLPLVGTRPVHGAKVVVIDRVLASEDGVECQDMGDAWVGRLRERLKRIEADAMLTDTPGFALGWAFGDCAPILLYDPRHTAIALVHAGWRGTAAGVAPAAIRAMSERYGTQPEELYAGIGPAIGSCCYEVSAAVWDAFAGNPLARECARFEERRMEGRSRLFLDIAGSNHAQLLAAGLAPGRIEASGYCTGCRTDLFYSNRREPWPSGRFAAAIGLRSVRE